MKINKVIVEISAHHCHISRSDLDIIYGKNYKLTPIKPLSQTGQFACKETVTIKVGDKSINGLRILGPERENSQVEISISESRYLKVNPPIVECSRPKNPKCCQIVEIIGPKGKVKRCALIVAFRHFHTDFITAENIGVKDKQLISLKIYGKRGITFHNVLVRVNKNFKPRVHLDTDEGNAAGLKGGELGEIILK